MLLELQSYLYLFIICLSMLIWIADWYSWNYKRSHWTCDGYGDNHARSAENSKIQIDDSRGIFSSLFSSYLHFLFLALFLLLSPYLLIFLSLPTHIHMCIFICLSLTIHSPTHSFPHSLTHSITQLHTHSLISFFLWNKTLFRNCYGRWSSYR